MLLTLLLLPYRRVSGIWQRRNWALRQIREAKRSAQAPSPSRIPTRIRYVWCDQERLKGAKQLAIFAHYDEDAQVSPAALAYVEEIANLGFCVVFVSSSPELSDLARLALAPHIGALIIRENVGHDFGAWRDGLSFINDPTTRDAILLANDSVYGPFAGLSELIDQFDDRADVWGLTESFEISRHLQSYFLYFRSTALRSRAFGQFWTDFPISATRFEAILSGEIGLSRFFRKQGLRLRAIAGYRDVRQTFRRRNREMLIAASPPVQGQPRGRSETAYLVGEGHTLNPTHYFWRELVNEFKLPFLKRDLVLRNPELIADADDARRKVEDWLRQLR